MTVVSCFHLFKARNVSFTEASAASFPARHSTAPVGKLSFYFCVFSRAQTTTDSIHIHKHVQTELTDILQQTNAVGCPAFHLKSEMDAWRFNLEHLQQRKWTRHAAGLTWMLKRAVILLWASLSSLWPCTVPSGRIWRWCPPFMQYSRASLR